MIKPIPPEISQVNVPAFVRSAWAMVATGDATAATTANVAATFSGLRM
jgi:hypothetical protein